MSTPCPCTQTTDRYVSFKGIDCAGNARAIMARIEYHMTHGHGSAFWDYFMNKRHPASGPKPDDLFLIHANLNQVRELFEEAEDENALELLFRLEEECC